MGRTQYFIGGLLAIIALAASFIPVSRAATVIGSVKFTNNSTYTAGIDTRFMAYTAIDRMTGYQNLSTYARNGESVNFATVTANAVSLTSWFISDDILSTIPDGGIFANRIGDALGTWAYTSDLVNHRIDLFNPHQVVPAQIFSNHSGVRYPLFSADNSYTWTRPLEACGTNPATAIFDGAPGAQGADGAPGATGADGADGATGGTVTFTVGTVEDLASGATPYVNYTGSGLTKTVNYGVVRGADGSSTVSQAQMLAELDNPSTGILTMQGNANSDIKMQLIYTDTQGTSMWMSSDGSVSWMDKDGKEAFGYSSDSKTLTFSNYSYGSTRKSMTIDRFGQIHRYAGDGTTLIFEQHTTGRIKRYLKTTGKLAEHIEPDGKLTRYRPDGIRARFTNTTSGTTIL
jgi:hypothetical protein